MQVWSKDWSHCEMKEDNANLLLLVPDQDELHKLELFLEDQHPKALKDEA